MTLALGLLGIASTASLAWVAALQVRGTVRTMVDVRATRRAKRLRTPLSLTVASRRDLSDTLFSITVADARGRRLPLAMPGQYVTVLVDDPAQSAPMRRAYSLSRWDARPVTYELVIRREPLGRASGLMHQAFTVGAPIMILPPRGEFVPSTDIVSPLLLVAGGVGITPLRAMVDAIVPSGRPVTLVHVARHECELVGHAALHALHEAHESFTYVPMLTQPVDGWRHGRGRVNTNQLRECYGGHVPPDLESFLCGPEAMMHALRDGLIAQGVLPTRCHIESFGNASMPTTAPDHPWTLNVVGSAPLTWNGEQTLLQCLEQHGVAVERDCGGGSCGSCVMRCVRGSVEQLRNAEYRTSPGVILTCCVRPTSDLVLERVAG